MSEVIHLTTDNFKQEKDKEGILLVDFWADWCGPCKMMSSIIDEVATELKDKVRVAKLNIDEHPEIAQEYGVLSIPTLITFKNGEEISKEVGARPKAKLLEGLQKQIITNSN